MWCSIACIACIDSVFSAYTRFTVCGAVLLVQCV